MQTFLDLQSNEDVLEKFFAKFIGIGDPRKTLQMCLDGTQSSAPEVEVGGFIYEVLFRCLSTNKGGRTDLPAHVIWVRDITQAKQLDRMKDEFMAVASHEMRTPLAIISGNAELLMEQEISEEEKKMIRSIFGNSRRLLNIVNDFLDVSRLEGGKIKLRKEEFDIRGVLNDAISDLTKLAQEKKLTLILKDIPSTPVLILGDKDRVRQVVVNLISNALHYTQHGSVTVSLQITSDGIVKLLFTDTGVGIEPDKQQLLFHKFQMVGTVFMHSKEYGSGLGLYITKLLMDAMGGHVVLEKSVLGEGSTFSVEFSSSVPSV